MALKSIVVGVGIALAFALGAIGGYVYAQLSEEISLKRASSRDTAFLRRLEEVQANLKCEDLERVGLVGPRRMDDVTIYIDVRDDYYYVIGLTSGAPETPLVSWTGAGRKETLRQLCG